MTSAEIINIDLFISHAWEDKQSLVRPLARYLRRLGIRVWYDEFSLSVGDSLSRSIDKGLAIAQYGLVVISTYFIQKRWTEYELRGLTVREVDTGGKVILPIWHGISKQEVINFSPSLADKVAIDTRGKTIEDIAESVIRVIRPDLADRASLLRYLARDRSGDNDNVTYEPIENLHLAPIPDEFVMEGHTIVRALNTVSILREADSKLVGNFTTFLIDLARDNDPEPELRVWETIAAVYSQVAGAFSLSPAEKPLVVKLALICSLESRMDVRHESAKGLKPEVIAAVIERWDYLATVNSSGHVRFVTSSVNEDASGAEVVDG